MLKSFTTVALASAIAATTFGPFAPAAASAATLSLPAPQRLTNATRTGPVTRTSTPALTRFLNSIGAKYVGRAAFSKKTIDVATPMRNAPALAAYAQSASNPRSVYYRHFLTPAQIGDAFGTPAAQYASTVATFKSLGLAVKPWTARSMVTVTGSQANLERAFSTRFGVYQFRNRVTGRYGTFVAPTGGISLPSTLGTVSLRSLVTAVTRTPHTFVGGPSVPVSGSFSNARVNGATPHELAQAFDYTGAYTAGYTGKGVNLGIVGTGGIGPDVPNYRKIFNVPGSSTVTIVPATVNGDSTPPPVTGPCAPSAVGSVGLPINDPTSGSSTSPTAGCNPEDVEAQLDTEQTSMLAYDSNVLFYLAYNGSGCTVEGNPLGSGCIGPASTSQGLDLADDELMQAVNDNQTDILSLSYGGCELLEGALSLTINPGADATGTDPTLFAELASEGIAVFVSSGDSGSAECQRNVSMSDAPNPSYPATDPNVVSVGGTTTPMLPTGQLSGPITGWGSQTKSGGAEGAGQSTLFVTPSYQSSVANVASVCTMRCEPDVVLDADPFTGAAVVFDTGVSGGAEEEPVGGTSQAAPDMAAMWALVLSACRVTPKCGGSSSSNVVDPPTGFSPTASPHAFRLGNPNFLIYPLAATTQATLYHQTFYDIVFGDDAVPPAAAALAAGEAAGAGGPTVDPYAAGVDPGAIEAGPGWDQTTGLGAPFARALIKYVVGV